jgi:uncharacterized protein YggU (UPF0235/DUF167 family)
MLDLFDHADPPSTLRVKVTPRAKTERIKKEAAPDGAPLYKIYVTAVAEHGKANAAVIALLAEALGIPRSSLTITRGLTSRNKTITVKR